MKLKEKTFFESNLWHEVQRFDSKENLIGTVTCTEENIENLYNSQFADKTLYKETFSYNTSYKEKP